MIRGKKGTSVELLILRNNGLITKKIVRDTNLLALFFLGPVFYPVLYGLIYDDGLIDFVEHPLDDGAACEDVTTSDHSASPRDSTMKETESETEGLSSPA